MSFSSEIFKMVHDLVAARPLQADGVAKVAKLALQPAASPPGGYFAIYKAHDDAHPHVKDAELRVPKPGATAADGILILDLQSKSCVAQAEVKAEFGDKAEPMFPSPNQPPSAPTYLVYRHPWGALRFGFERGGRECLVTVVIDATKKGG